MVDINVKKALFLIIMLFCNILGIYMLMNFDIETIFNSPIWFIIGFAFLVDVQCFTILITGY